MVGSVCAVAAESVSINGCFALSRRRIMGSPTTSNFPLKRWIWLAVFAAAFAWVESAVVIDLREIFFAGDFQFPLVIVREAGVRVVDPLVKIEFGREIATLVMLISVAVLAGRNRLQRVCFFAVAFGIWDIFYYIWLRVLTGWPESLMTWDLLFYVPLPWVGPVITPVFIALVMVVYGSLFLRAESLGYHVRFVWRDWLVLSACTVALIVAFCWDWQNILRLPGAAVRTGVPETFAWWLYVPALSAAVIYLTVRWRNFIQQQDLAQRR